MSLNTFGAIITFAIEFEDALQSFYKAASAVGGESAELFTRYARKSGERKQRLIGIRQENVTEMVLEPISGLNIDDYQPTPAVPADRAAAVAEALRLEKRAERFYTDAGPKINVSEPRRAFAKFAQENAKRLQEIKA